MLNERMEITRKDEATSRTETQRYRGAQRIYSTNILWQIPLLLLTITIASARTEETEPTASQPFPQRRVPNLSPGYHLCAGNWEAVPLLSLCSGFIQTMGCYKNDYQNQLLPNNPSVQGRLVLPPLFPLCLRARRSPIPLCLVYSMKRATLSSVSLRFSRGAVSSLG